MGNASVSRRDEASPSEATSGEEAAGADYMEYAHVNYHAPHPFQDSMVQSSVYSPMAYHPPLLFNPQMARTISWSHPHSIYPVLSPQSSSVVRARGLARVSDKKELASACISVGCNYMVSVTPLQRPDMNQFQINTTKQTTNLSDKRKPKIITWRNEGNQVAVEGSWDNWETREFLQRSGKDLTIMKVLPVGVYYYQFIVDGCRMCASDLPQERDNMGNVFNVLDLEDHISECENTSESESESSPVSSYNNEYFSLEGFNEKVPEMPSILERTPLNQHQWSDSPQSQEKPLPSILNHLYIHKPPRGEHMAALSSTQRFRKKYVTVVLYKSLQNL